MAQHARKSASRLGTRDDRSSWVLLLLLLASSSAHRGNTFWGNRLCHDHLVLPACHASLHRGSMRNASRQKRTSSTTSSTTTSTTTTTTNRYNYNLIKMQHKRGIRRRQRKRRRPPKQRQHHSTLAERSRMPASESQQTGQSFLPISVLQAFYAKQQQLLQNNNVSPSLWQWELHPSSMLEEERRQRRLYLRRRKLRRRAESGNNTTVSQIDLDAIDDSDEFQFVIPSSWLEAARYTNGMYATIPDPADPRNKAKRQLHEFHQYRHLSRYEREYRLANGLDLQLDWNGTYSFLVDDNQLHQYQQPPLSLVDDQGEECDPFHPQDVTRQYRNATMKASSGLRRRSRRQRCGPRQLQQIYDTSMITAGGLFNNYQAVPLSQGYGTHFSNVWVGSPTPQRKTVIVDTGSHYTAFPCAGCRNCGAPHHTDPYFDPALSETFHQLLCEECRDGVMCDAGQCKFHQAYTEGSTWEAVQVQDRFYCGGSDVLDSVDPQDEKYTLTFMYGCIFKMTGLFITQLADGIMGMSAHPATLPKKLHEAGLIEHNLFAMCFRRELGTSKKGVTAGSMTLGGISNNLDTSPMVYAKNLAKMGWYTVYVKAIYVRTGGGPSASSTDQRHGRTIRVRIDPATLNSGKGVIVDSGTTDTYLHKQVAKEFNKAWMVAAGQPYSNVPITLTPEQLLNLPTILIQCQAESSQPDPSIENYSTLTGFAGVLDPNSPNDLLIAIPSTSYMDYSPITKKYMSRLYFTESAGGVLGSNTMQGHNVVFDWQHGRVGFAESSCTYDKKDVPVAALDDGYATDCRIGRPVLTTPCINNVDVSMCRSNPTSIALIGSELWTAVVESPGTAGGVSCLEAAQDAVTSNQYRKKGGNDDDGPIVVCDGRGLCQENRTCLLTCPEVQRAIKVHPVSSNTARKDRPSGLACGDSFWSACDFACQQARIVSAQHSDGHCHETSREIRPCHTGACARSDPCRVPFLVHVVFGFLGGSVSQWTLRSEDMIVTALIKAAVAVAPRLLSGNDPLFQAGDVHVITALKWTRDDEDDESRIVAGGRRLEDGTLDGAAGVADDDNADDDELDGVLGTKVVVEISIYNALADRAKQVARNNRTTAAPREGDRPDHPAGCGPDELYVIAKRALAVKKDILEHRFFAGYLTAELRNLGHRVAWIEDAAPFAATKLPNSIGSTSRILKSWTIRTPIDDGTDEINFFGPPRPFYMKVLAIVHGATLISSVVLLILTVWSFLAALYDTVCGGRSGDFFFSVSWDCWSKVKVYFGQDGSMPSGSLRDDDRVEGDERSNPNDQEEIIIRGASDRYVGLFRRARTLRSGSGMDDA